MKILRSYSEGGIDASGLGVERVADLNSAKNLDLSFNRLTEWPMTSGAIRLNLSHNQLTSFEAVGVNDGLVHLNVSHNRLSRIQLTKEMASLSLLDATNTSLSELDTAAAPMLVSLVAPYNQIASVGKLTTPSLLRYIDLSYNLIADWSAFTPPVGIRTLNATNNQASVFLQGNWSAMAHKFETAIFTNNNLTDISGIVWPPTLAYLDLRGNPLQSIEIFKSDLSIFQNLKTFLVPETAASPSSARCAKRNATATPVANGITVCVVSAAFDVSAKPSPGMKTDSPSSAQNPVPSKSSSNSKMWIIVAAATGCVIALALLIVVIRRRRTQNDQSAYKLRHSFSITTSSSHKGEMMKIIALLRSDELLMAMHIDASDVENIRDLSSSGPTITSLVRVGERRLVCKKIVVPIASGCDNAVMQLVQEIKASATLEHTRIVKYRGFTAAPGGDLAIFLEFMANGSLVSLLDACTNGECQLPWLPSAKPTTDGQLGVSRLGLAIDVAEALVYLHSFDPPVVHEEICAKNVFLDSRWRAKLRVGRKLTSSVIKPGPQPWLAPKIVTSFTVIENSFQTNFDDTSICTTASDVYAFGVFLLELDSCGNPGLGQFHGDCPSEIRDIATSCLEIDPARRPSSMAVFYSMSQLRKRIKQSSDALLI